MMAQKRVDGLLVMCSEYPEPLLAMLEEYRHIPMVVMDWGEAKLTSPMRSLITRLKAATWPGVI